MDFDIEEEARNRRDEDENSKPYEFVSNLERFRVNFAIAALGFVHAKLRRRLHKVLKQMKGVTSVLSKSSGNNGVQVHGGPVWGLLSKESQNNENFRAALDVLVSARRMFTSNKVIFSENIRVDIRKFYRNLYGSYPSGNIVMNCDLILYLDGMLSENVKRVEDASHENHEKLQGLMDEWWGAWEKMYRLQAGKKLVDMDFDVSIITSKTALILKRFYESCNYFGAAIKQLKGNEDILMRERSGIYDMKDMQGASQSQDHPQEENKVPDVDEIRKHLHNFKNAMGDLKKSFHQTSDVTQASNNQGKSNTNIGNAQGQHVRDWVDRGIQSLTPDDVLQHLQPVIETFKWSHEFLKATGIPCINEGYDGSDIVNLPRDGNVCFKKQADMVLFQSWSRGETIKDTNKLLFLQDEYEIFSFLTWKEKFCSFLLKHDSSVYSLLSDPANTYVYRGEQPPRSNQQLNVKHVLVLDLFDWKALTYGQFKTVFESCRNLVEQADKGKLTIPENLVKYMHGAIEIMAAMAIIQRAQRERGLSMQWKGYMIYMTSCLRQNVRELEACLQKYNENAADSSRKSGLWDTVSKLWRFGKGDTRNANSVQQVNKQSQGKDIEGMQNRENTSNVLMENEENAPKISEDQLRMWYMQMMIKRTQKTLTDEEKGLILEYDLIYAKRGLAKTKNETHDDFSRKSNFLKAISNFFDRRGHDADNKPQGMTGAGGSEAGQQPKENRVNSSDSVQQTNKHPKSQDSSANSAQETNNHPTEKTDDEKVKDLADEFASLSLKTTSNQPQSEESGAKNVQETNNHPQPEDSSASSEKETDNSEIVEEPVTNKSDKEIRKLAQTFKLDQDGMDFLGIQGFKDGNFDAITDTNVKRTMTRVQGIILQPEQDVDESDRDYYNEVAEKYMLFQLISSILFFTKGVSKFTQDIYDDDGLRIFKSKLKGQCSIQERSHWTGTFMGLFDLNPFIAFLNERPQKVIENFLKSNQERMTSNDWIARHIIESWVYDIFEIMGMIAVLNGRVVTPGLSKYGKGLYERLLLRLKDFLQGMNSTYSGNVSNHDGPGQEAGPAAAAQRRIISASNNKPTVKPDRSGNDDASVGRQRYGGTGNATRRRPGQSRTRIMDLIAAQETPLSEAKKNPSKPNLMGLNYELHNKYKR